MKGRLSTNTTHLKLDKEKRKEEMIHWFFFLKKGKSKRMVRLQGTAEFIGSRDVLASVPLHHLALLPCLWVSFSSTFAPGGQQDTLQRWPSEFTVRRENILLPCPWNIC